ncbi:MAG: putative toxin-antitoxin system toxin component, PIN family [Acidobacteria bacterium]|nr:MAG: putative toxin-antitoxin system toxin component, PIN family [Acidobacteriota bacterium]
MAAKPRAVLDTNVFVSGLISPRGLPAAILRALRSERFTLVSSPPINEEIIGVINRPTIRDRYGLGDRIFDVSFILWDIAELVIALPDVRVPSDPDDNKFLATADAGRADYLVTGDVGDLLRLHNYKDVAIVSPREFASVLKL